jgi:dCTP deaminase
MILSDREIKLELEAGVLRIEPPPEPQDISPSSIDLHLSSRLFIPRKPPSGLSAVVELDSPDIHKLLQELYEPFDMGPEGYEVKKGQFLLGYTEERIYLPPHLAGWVEGRSTIARYGLAVHITAPTIHPTFVGHLMLEMSLFGEWSCRLKPGLSIAQLVLARVGIAPLDSLRSVWLDQGPD